MKIIPPIIYHRKGDLSMSNKEKADRILAVMARIRAHDVIHLTAEDIISKCSQNELDLYYNKLCREEEKRNV